MGYEGFGNGLCGAFRAQARDTMRQLPSSLMRSIIATLRFAPVPFINTSQAATTTATSPKNRTPFSRTISWDERSIIQVSRFMRSINASTFCRLMGWGRARRESKRTRRHPNQRGLPSQRDWVPFASRVYRRLFNLFHPVTLACLSLQQQPDAAERDSTGNSSCRRLKWERRVCKNMHIHRHASPSPEVVGSSRYYWPLEHPTPWQGTGRPACKLAGHLGWIGLHTRQAHRLCMNADIHLAHAVAG
jgi:hypothetical protein